MKNLSFKYLSLFCLGSIILKVAFTFVLLLTYHCIFAQESGGTENLASTDKMNWLALSYGLLLPNLSDLFVILIAFVIGIVSAVLYKAYTWLNVIIGVGLILILKYIELSSGSTIGMGILYLTMLDLSSIAIVSLALISLCMSVVSFAYMFRIARRQSLLPD